LRCSLFIDQLTRSIRSKNSRLVVGLDPHWDRIPAAFKSASAGPAAAVEAYFTKVIAVSHPYAAAFKPQIAFFEPLGAPGLAVLSRLLRLIRGTGTPIIMDAKRNDIGSTAQAYARAFFGNDDQPPAFDSDALTVNAYLGWDGIQPFLRDDKGIFVLVKTSNASSGEFQDLVLENGSTLSEAVAEKVNQWTSMTLGDCGYGNVGAVVGATYPDHMRRLRQSMPNAYLLVPGYGAQGGSDDAVRAAFDRDGLGAVINSSRGICFPPEFERLEFRAVADAAQRTRDAIQALLP